MAIATYGPALALELGRYCIPIENINSTLHFYICTLKVIATHLSIMNMANVFITD